MDRIKILLGINKFLSTEIGKRYSSLYYPEIKKRLSKAGFGRFIKTITLTYNILEDESYNEPGAVEEHSTFSKSEKKLEVAALSSSHTEVPRYVDVWSKVGSEIKERLGLINQENIGTCAIHTVQNIVNQIVVERGLDEMVELDISLMYRDYRYKGNPEVEGSDYGTVVDWLIRDLIEDGVPLRTTRVIFDRKDLLALDQSKRLDSGRSFRMDIFDEVVSKGYTIEKLAQDCEEYNSYNHKIQTSLDVYRHNTKSKGYWWNLVIQWHKGMYKTGRHSTAMVFMNYKGTDIGVMDLDGERGYLSADSGDGIVKFMKDSYLDKSDWNYRVIRLKDSFGGERLDYDIEEPLEEEEDVLETAVIKYGQRSDAVVALQEYLIYSGYKISKATGYFGNETMRALTKWQINMLGRSYGGTVWGNISQSTYKLLKSQ